MLKLIGAYFFGLAGIGLSLIPFFPITQTVGLVMGGVACALVLHGRGRTNQNNVSRQFRRARFIAMLLCFSAIACNIFIWGIGIYAIHKLSTF